MRGLLVSLERSVPLVHFNRDISKEEGSTGQQSTILQFPEGREAINDTITVPQTAAATAKKRFAYVL